MRRKPEPFPFHFPAMSGTLEWTFSRDDALRGPPHFEGMTATRKLKYPTPAEMEERIYCSEQIKIPVEYPEIIKQYSKAVLAE